jgi:hypothetical protein
MLDNNLLDALPGFLLKMSSLETVHRHGNHNYFKSTFMWYHTDVNERILGVPGNAEFLPPSTRRPRPLQFWCAKAIVGSKMDFFATRTIAPAMRDYISNIYGQFNVCGCCNKAKLSDQSGRPKVVCDEFFALHFFLFLAVFSLHALSSMDDTVNVSKIRIAYIALLHPGT